MTHTIFIDGEEGTTGLQIRERLEGRAELDLIHLSENKRKDTDTRREALNDADIAILCLPDEAAREAVSMIGSKNTRVIDASTAHRVADGWTYGFPEMTPEQADVVRGAARVANPGCYPTGAIAMIRPMVDTGIVPVNYPVSVNAVSGYSGGGKGLIALMENADADNAIDSAWFGYGLALAHKHVPEMQQYSGWSTRRCSVPASAGSDRGWWCRSRCNCGACHRCRRPTKSGKFCRRGIGVARL